MLRRGNATSGAPICNGTMMLPNAVKSGVAKRNSMIVPCMVNSWLYWTFDCSIMPGAKSSNRMTMAMIPARMKTVSYTHLRAHETRHDLVCRLLLEKKKQTIIQEKNKNKHKKIPFHTHQ